MTAGSGIVHREMPHEDGGHLLQLWINLPSFAKKQPPRYQDIRYESTPKVTKDGVTYRLISGEYEGLKSNTQNVVPIQMLEIYAEQGSTARIDIPAQHNTFMYVISGSGKFGARRDLVNAGEVIWLSQSEISSFVTIECEASLHIFFAGGVPIKENVVARGPFVLNSLEEIQEAYDDFYSGKMGGPVQKK
jgi:hypothetical protein